MVAQINQLNQLACGRIAGALGEVARIAEAAAERGIGCLDRKRAYLRCCDGNRHRHDNRRNGCPRDKRSKKQAPRYATKPH